LGGLVLEAKVRRTWVYRKNEQTGEVVAEEITAEPIEWINGGVRYGTETLEKMRKQGLVPPETFSEKWAAKSAEKERIARLAAGDVSQVKNDAAAVARKRELYHRLTTYRPEQYRDAPFKRRG
jgi:hypothetical protein